MSITSAFGLKNFWLPGAWFRSRRFAYLTMKRSSSSPGSGESQRKRKATSSNEAVVAPNIAARPQLPTSFPRGGGTGLTPVEYRQSVLEGRKESAATDDLFQESMSASKKMRGTKRKKEKKASVKAEASKDRIRVELLNYKRLLPGTKILCNIQAIHPLALVVSMCDQMLGHIPVTSVSEKLTERLQNALDQDDEDDEEEDEEDEDEEDGPPELPDIFSVGQWVRASVESVTSIGSKRQWGMGREGGEYERESQRVQLTMEPRIVNEGIRADDLSEGYLLSATVQSREDYGYSLDLGVSDDVHGFIPTKEILRVGAVLLVQVASVDGRAVKCKQVQQAAPVPVSTPPSQSAILPGLPVKALITSHVPQGLCVKLFGMLDGTIDSFHLPRDVDEKDLAPGKKVIARVLWNMPGDFEQAQEASVDAVGARRIGLSCAPHVCSMEAPLVNAKPLTEAFPIGTPLRVRVVTVFREWGLVCQVIGHDVGAFVHISFVSDEHVDALSATAGPWCVGTEHQARVTGHALTDRLLMISLQASVLEKEFMRVSEVPLGRVVRVSIRKVTPKAIFVRLNGNVDGVVFPLHFSDVRLTHPEKKFKPNLELKARIIHTDPMRNRIVLSFKRSLVTSELPLVAHMNEAKVGVITNAVVLRHLQASILVELGGTLRAVIPFSEASATTMLSEQLQQLYPAGKVVKVRITKVEPETGRIMASIKQTSPEFLQHLNVEAVQVGESVKARFVSAQDGVAITLLEPSSTRALLALSNLAQQRNTTVDELEASLEEGELLEDLYVVSKHAAKGFVVLSHEKPVSKKHIQPGDVYEGCVVQRQDEHLFCHVALKGTSCRARLHITECLDDLTKARLPEVGEHVTCCVLRARKGGNEADVSIRPSRLTSDAQVKDPAIGSSDQLEAGMHLHGIVKAITNHGVYVALGPHTDGRVMIKELFDEYIKDFRSQFHVGECVRGTVLHVEPNGQVEMSLKKSRLGQAVVQDVFADLQVGQKVAARVRATAEYGVFLKIDGTDISGLCHKSELSDNKTSDAVRAFAVGDRVKAVILKLDHEKKRISFGLKPSYFADEDFDDEEDEQEEDSDEEDEDDEYDDEDDEEEEVAHSLVDDEAEDEDEDGDEDEDENGDEDGEDDEDEDNEDLVDLMDDEDDDEDSMDDDVDESMGDLDPNDDVTKNHVDEAESDGDDGDDALPARSIQEGFRWGAPEQESEDDSDEDELDKSTRPAKKAKSDDITADLSAKKLDSATDFERVLLGSPNSSYLWIQFMTFYLQLGDVDKARQVARRAIKVIHYREEQEKLNVWMALLNIENLYGSPETLDAVFKEAVLCNDALEVHMRLLSIFEHGDKVDEALALFPRTAKKFGFVPDVWIRWYEFLLQHERSDDAHALVSRSLQSLDRTKHLRALTAYALAEYKLGDVEHARTLFETLVERYPKRSDLWWQYVDQEVRLENIEGARSLMERCLVARKHTTKQIKALLQKWLVIEKRIGDQAGVQRVLERARDFVARVQQGSVDEQAESEEDE